MRTATALLLIVIIAGLLAGCNTAIEGLRLAPGESLRQQGTENAQLAAAGRYVPFSPGSAAANQLAQSAGISASYIGQPKSPLDVNPLIQAEYEKYLARQRDEVRKKVKSDLIARGQELIGRSMAKYAEKLSKQQGKTVAIAEVIAQAEVVNEISGSIFEAAGAITLEGDKGPNAELLAAINAAISNANKSAYAAKTEAAKRPTGSEVAAKVADSADSVLGEIGDYAERYGLEGLIATTGLGGLFYGAKKRRDQKKAKAETEKVAIERDKAKHDEQWAKMEATIAKQTVATAQGAAEALANANKDATEKLAQAMPTQTITATLEETKTKTNA